MNLHAITNPVDTSSASHFVDSTNNLWQLPAELLIEIAEQLAATYRLATLASFNTACRRIHDASLPVLFRSMILVTRDPEDSVEVERAITVTEEDEMPKSWQHVKYLSVGKNALDTLTKLGDSKRQKTSDKGPLENLFPRLTVVFFRMSDLENRNNDRKRPDRQASRPRSPGTSTTTRVRADIYRPIKPSSLMTACVIGRHLRETSIAGTVIQQADGTCSGDFPEAKVVDNLYQIRFTPNGTFLPQSEGDAFAFPGHVGDRPGIEVDPMTLDNDDPIGSRSRDIARGIFVLLPPRSVKLGEHSILPKIKISGTGVSFKPFLCELVHHFPVKATTEIADKRLLSLSQTIHDIKWTATQLQARYDDLDVPHEGYNQILDVRAMGANDSETECSWFGTLFDRHRGIGGTLSNGDAVPPGIGYRQLHYFDTDREQGMIRNDWVYTAGQTGKVVLIEEIRETRTRG